MAEWTDHYEALDLGNIVTVRFLKNAVACTTQTSELRSMLLAEVDRRRPTTLIFDFRHVRQISSDVVFLMLQIRRRMADRGCEIRLAGLRPAVREVFQCLQLDGALLPIFETFEDALQANTAVRMAA